MSQEPWNEEIYQSSENSRKNRAEKGSASAKLFTILAVIFLIIVIGITLLALFLSSGGSNTDSTKEFYNASNAAQIEASSQEEVPASESSSTEEVAEETTTSSSLEEATDGSTLTVKPGEGEASIAARAGISIADLERLNPEKMATGTWLAHPGDVVRIK